MPSPPDGFAVQVADPPVVIEAGETKHEPLTGLRTVTVTGAEFFELPNAPPTPPLTLQVAM